jgi:hypothetical protein
MFSLRITIPCEEWRPNAALQRLGDISIVRQIVDPIHADFGTLQALVEQHHSQSLAL